MQSALGLVSNNPGLMQHFPTNPRTIYQKYVLGMDIRTSYDLMEIFNTAPGLLTVASDGATFLAKSKV